QLTIGDQGLQRIETAVEQKRAPHSEVIEQEAYARGELELAIVVHDHRAASRDTQCAKQLCPSREIRECPRRLTEVGQLVDVDRDGIVDKTWIGDLER